MNARLTLYCPGKKAEAMRHYMEAANLTPGNRVIWDAFPLRASRFSDDLLKASFLDATSQ